MDGETGFGELYKKLIDGHFAPEQNRADAVLRALLGRLPARDPPEKTVEVPKQT